MSSFGNVKQANFILQIKAKAKARSCKNKQ
jgi:hypothetical protein